MPPNQGLVHLKEYDIKDSNVELIGSDIDHKVKYASAAAEPAWNNGRIGVESGLYIWRIENFEVVPVPPEKAGQFFDGDSYIVLHSYKVGSKDDAEKLGHELFFWLGAHTSQDEAGVAAYKTVELDEFLHGAATQHRELQESPSDGFLELFPRLSIRKGGVASGFWHVQPESKDESLTLLRISKHSGAAPGKDGMIVVEVEPTWESLDDDDVFVLDTGDKIWVWQGRQCSPMEKAKAAQIVHDMTLAKHVDVEVLSQTESRSIVIVKLLGGSDAVGSSAGSFKKARPVSSIRQKADVQRPRKLFRLSDASGGVSFNLVKSDQHITRGDFDGDDIFLLDDAGQKIWVWEGLGASNAEKALWLKVAQAYVRQLVSEATDGAGEAHLTPIGKVQQGNESPAFWKAVAV